MQTPQPSAAAGLNIELTPYPNPAAVREGQKKVVLLVHGASASRRTFEQRKPGLAGYLNGLLKVTDPEKRELESAEVYALDWRSSLLTSERLVTGCLPTQDAELFTLDAAVDDLVKALAQVNTATGVPIEEIRIVGHCIGGALVAQAIADGKCACKHVVLSALALFFKVGVEGWFKGNDFVLEKELAKSIDPETVRNPKQPFKGRIISANVAHDPEPYEWPEELEERFRFWLGSGLHHGCGNPFCERISFMYGMPFRLDDMKYLHDEPGGLEQQFGSMPLGIYAHCLRNLRRGWAAKYNGAENEERAFVDDKARQNFAGRHITLITGNENQVWHRNSMDLMHEWLGNGRALPGLHLKKHVLRGYGHQDLYWSNNAPKDVYPLIAEGLGLLRPKSG